MKIKNGVIIYFFIWICTLNLTQWFYFWFRLELLNWILLIFLARPLIFLLWQSLSSLLLIYSWAVIERNIFLVFSLLLKSGIVPFSLFILKLRWKWRSWLLFLTSHKLLPFLLLILVNLFFFLYFIWILIRIFYLYQNSRLFNIMWLRSLSESAWLCLPLNLTKIFIFFLFYSFSWWAWASSQNKITFKVNRINRRLMFILTLALPPSLIFLIKVYIWTNLNLISGCILALLSWRIIFVYFKWWVLNISIICSIPESLNLWFWNFWIISGHLGVFLFW